MELLRTAAVENRRLAEHARRLAGLMHQPDVKKNLARQSAALDQLAKDIEDLVHRYSSGGAAFAND
jgi:hypothetical protein